MPLMEILVWLAMVALGWCAKHNIGENVDNGLLGKGTYSAYKKHRKNHIYV